MWSLVAALLFLWVGFGLGLRGYSGNALYDGSVTGFVWMARIVGIGLVIVSVLGYLRLRFAVPLNFALAALATAGCLGAGAIWFSFGDYQDSLLLLVFGLVNASAARSAWLQWRHG